MEGRARGALWRCSRKVTINPFAAHMGPPAPPPRPAVSVDGAVLSGFRLIRREPAAVLLWGLCAVVFSIVSLALFAPVYADMIGVWRAALLEGAAAAPPPGLAADGLRIQGLSWLLTIASLILRAVVVAAVCRAVQRPQDRRFGYLRLGMAEFFLLLVYVGVYLAAMVAIVVVVIAFTVMTIALGMAHALPVAIGLDVLGAIAMLVGAVYLGLRLSLIAPMVVADEKPHLAASWSLTRGRVATLLLIGLCLVGIFITVELVVGGLFLVAGASLIGGIGGPDRLAAVLAQPPATILTRLAPWLAALAVIGVPLAGAFYAIMAAPWARAWLDLAGRAAGETAG